MKRWTVFLSERVHEFLIYEEPTKGRMERPLWPRPRNVLVPETKEKSGRGSKRKNKKVFVFSNQLDTNLYTCCLVLYLSIHFPIFTIRGLDPFEGKNIRILLLYLFSLPHLGRPSLTI